MARAPALQLSGLAKSFGGAFAVRNVGLEVAPGELFALLGASGCGKTTLLRLIAGLESPDAGRVFIDGVDMTDAPPYRRPVNTVFQSYALFPHMSVAENVAFGLKQDGMSGPAIAARVREMLELVKLGTLDERRPHQLSGGQRQRVALARSLAKLPKVLLLDEPMAALDRKLREETQLELVALQQQVGITFVLVTHDQDEAMSMAHRMAVMKDGTIAQIGSPREIYEAPKSRFVADFIGRVNLFEGMVVGRDAVQTTVKLASGNVHVVCRRDVAAGATVALAVRPEKIAIGAGGPGANRGAGVVREVSYFGDHSIVHVETVDRRTVRIAAPNIDGTGLERPARGQHVAFHWAPEGAVVLQE